MKFDQYITTYLKEYLIYKEHEGVLNFIKFLKSKNVEEVNDDNFEKLVNEFGGLDQEYIKSFYCEFVNELRNIGIKTNLSY